MLALSAKEIVLGKQSNLGPIDPQYGGMSCAGIIEEFDEALSAVSKDASAAKIWGLIIQKYHPTFIGDCRKAISWSESMVKEWLEKNMFESYSDKEEKADKVIEMLSSHAKTFSHSRHIHIDELKALGLNIIELEGLDNRKISGCKDLQDCVLTIHHAYMQSLSQTSAIKIIENHNGGAMIMNKTN